MSMTSNPQKDMYDYTYDDSARIRGLALTMRRHLSMALTSCPDAPSRSLQSIAPDEIQRLLVALALLVILGIVAAFVVAFAGLLLLLLLIGFLCVVVLDL
ncbi:hypothetical protein GLOTRDRAFT_128504 [Gloeophyllum trabeum ATCC 11539]|uniref:Uncharacterized protein n=1 Tax=Gloeophyllum trabeum (strain ATCC 11539 / FP-39264 / Madison 617) TaxID=670483 RepID=S7QB67_GLOTA|nr:uncharacterized protein GLOTRDRAFT_128504 [Gloeophyllum trabeum ATCC 11539]EPQ56562.1 hypothetical protein GLOTRDRAFT_128504 [Gloeophyllum trabeum ATCC 11539]